MNPPHIGSQRRVDARLVMKKGFSSIQSSRKPNARRMLPLNAMDSEDSDLAAALQESLELYDSALKLSSLQVKAEMEQLFASEANDESPTGTISPEFMLSFWVEMGLSENAAQRLLAEIDSTGRRYSTDVCAAKVQR